MHPSCVNSKSDNKNKKQIKKNLYNKIIQPIEEKFKTTELYKKADRLIQKGRKNRVTNTLINGGASGLKTLWMLGKIVIPVQFIITILDHASILNLISNLFSPVMQYLGLPGEAAIVLVLGNTINLFAAMTAIANIALTSKQITIIAVMLSFSHSLFMETAVAKKTGLSAVIVVLIRFTLAIISGIVLNLVL